MPISAIGRTNAHGLTLVELLVVMLIIGMASAAVVFAIPKGQSGLAAAAQLLERDVASARDGAVARQEVIGLMFEPRSLLLMTMSEGGWQVQRETAWPSRIVLEALPDDGFALPEHEEDIAFGKRFGSTKSGDDEPFRPKIIFTPEGSVTPFAVRLQDGRESLLMRVGPFGRIAVTDD